MQFRNTCATKVFFFFWCYFVSSNKHTGNWLPSLDFSVFYTFKNTEQANAPLGPNTANKYTELTNEEIITAFESVQITFQCCVWLWEPALKAPPKEDGQEGRRGACSLPRIEMGKGGCDGWGCPETPEEQAGRPGRKRGPCCRV